jgi:chromosome segregation ATPase
MNWTEAVVNLLIALGAVGGVGGGGRWAWRRFRSGRNVEQQQAQITAAERLQNLSLELVEPLRRELEEARGECRDLRHEIKTARQEVDQANNGARAANRELNEARVEIAAILGWAQKANDLLTRNHLPIEPIPIRSTQ